MPAAPRSNKKATQIAFSIIGIPDNLKECFKGFRKLKSKESNIDNPTYAWPNTNPRKDGSNYDSFL
jgi:hypothetical protein